MPNNPKFAASEESLAACTEVINDWRDEHKVEVNLEESIRMLASRVKSWVTPHSVAAGVNDVMSATLGSGMKEQITQLGDRLGKRLMEEGLLVGSLRRTSNVGG